MKKKFEKLNIENRALLLLDHGSIIAQRRYFVYEITLYALDGCYVEVWYNCYEERIQQIEIVEDTEILEEYLGQIELAGVEKMLFDGNERERYLADANRRQALRKKSEYKWRAYLKQEVPQDTNSEMEQMNSVKIHSFRKMLSSGKKGLASGIKYVIFIAIINGLISIGKGKDDDTPIADNSLVSDGRSFVWNPDYNVLNEKLSKGNNNLEAKGDSLK